MILLVIFRVALKAFAALATLDILDNDIGFIIIIQGTNNRAAATELLNGNVGIAKASGGEVLKRQFSQATHELISREGNAAELHARGNGIVASRIVLNRMERNESRGEGGLVFKDLNQYFRAVA